jgi:acetolactate synthase-1/3 small subunit
MEDKNSHQRELLMVKVNSTGDSRSNIESVIGKYRASIVSQASSSLTIEAIGSSAEIEALLGELSRFGIKELVQSGLIALENGDATLAERTLQETGLASSSTHSQTEDYQN